MVLLGAFRCNLSIHSAFKAGMTARFRWFWWRPNMEHGYQTRDEREGSP